MKRVILDVDTGIDDALAIAFAVRHPGVELAAVVAVAGNVSLAKTTRNTLRVLEWLGATDVPVYSGADGPIEGEQRYATYWHGEDGLGGAQLPDAARAAQPDGVGFLCSALLEQPRELTLVCTGPLTDLALAIDREPGIVHTDSAIVLMGGTVRTAGNTTPTAEFNIYADPVAAARVFDQSWPITMVGLDVTQRVTFSREDRKALANRTSAGATLVREVTRDLFEVKAIQSFALHDPLAVAVAVQPDLVETEHRDVHVETQGKHTLGQTVVDTRVSAPPAKLNTRVCTNVNVDAARALFFSTLGLSS